MPATDEHPNVALIKRLDLRNMAAAADLFTEDVVWHFFNPRLPDIQGDYVGLSGVGDFFAKITDRSSGTFQIQPVSLMPVGDELVVAHTRNSLSLDGQQVTTDVVVVWRIVDGRIAEIWDIPSVYTKAA